MSWGIFRRYYIPPPPQQTALTTLSGNSDLHEINAVWTALPPRGLQSRLGDTSIANFTQTGSPALEDVVPPALGNGSAEQWALPPMGKPPLPKSFTGWFGRDNEVSAAAASTALPTRSRRKQPDYRGYQYFVVTADNFDYPPARVSFDLPLGPDTRDYTGFLRAPYPDDIIEASQRIHVEVPLFKNKHEYTGWQNPAVVDDINEWLEKVFALPQLGRDRNQYEGTQSSDVIERDETGAAVEFRGQDYVTIVPPWVRDSNSYDGVQLEPQREGIEDPVAGFQFDALYPLGPNSVFDIRDYIGYQQRTDLDPLREPLVAGYIFTDLAPPGPNTFHDIRDYLGRTITPLPPDFVPGTGPMWKPIVRPRRR